MKLKGKAAKNIPPAKKAKMEKTLKVMEETRKKSNILLSNKVAQKLAWLKAEKEKGLKALNDIDNKRSKLRDQILRLEGAIVVISELVTKKEEN